MRPQGGLLSPARRPYCPLAAGATPTGARRMGREDTPRNPEPLVASPWFAYGWNSNTCSTDGGGGGMALTDERPVSSAPAPSLDRQPPQDLAAEQSVLGGMLLSKDAIADVVEVLRSGD